jgi:hypothetical protein
MAITSAQMQTALGDGNVNVPQVIRHFGVQGSLQGWLIKGGVTYHGRIKKIDTTAADNATNQAATVVASLLAGPA